MYRAGSPSFNFLFVQRRARDVQEKSKEPARAPLNKQKMDLVGLVFYRRVTPDGVHKSSGIGDRFGTENFGRLDQKDGAAGRH